MNLLQTTYMGLTLKSPIIAGSSGLSKSIENIIEMENNGIGAIVLKSIFEEQIRNEMRRHLNTSITDLSPYPEAYDYISNFSKVNAANEYIELIQKAKASVKVPIIASINCISNTEWVEYAKRFQDAGADAIELNIFILPSDYSLSASEIEERYIKIIEQVLKHVSIPVSIKIGEYFTSLAKTIITFSWTGIKGIVLFNRPYMPDINIENLTLTASNIFSNESEMAHPLRWIALLSDKSHCDLAASTGVHNGESVVKLLLAGASAVQICSVLYKKKFGVIKEMNDFIINWMNKNNYKSISEFKGKMSYKNIPNPAAYERVQFMKYYSGIE